MTIWCSLLGHHRSCSKARLNPRTALYESCCSHCHAPMIRLDRGKWLLRDQLPESERLNWTIEGPR